MRAIWDIRIQICSCELILEGENSLREKRFNTCSHHNSISVSFLASIWVYVENSIRLRLGFDSAPSWFRMHEDELSVKVERLIWFRWFKWFHSHFSSSIFFVSNLALELKCEVRLKWEEARANVPWCEDVDASLVTKVHWTHTLAWHGLDQGPNDPSYWHPPP